MTITVKTKSGAIQTIQVEELMSVDGKPIAQPDSVELRDRLAYLEGRVDTLERMVAPQELSMGADEMTSLAQ